MCWFAIILSKFARDNLNAAIESFNIDAYSFT